MYAANANTTVVGGYTHYLGEEKDGGIIFYLFTGSDGLEHGLIVSNTESTPVKWQNAFAQTNATRLDDGVYNTQLMTDSPAKDYVSSLGTGWYIPSMDEIMLLFSNRYYINKTIDLTSGTTMAGSLSSPPYWSSTESVTNSNTAVVLWSYKDFDITGQNKTLNGIVRAIRSF